MAEVPSMRLDMFLWYARLAPSRSAARAIAISGRLRLDGRRIERAHTPVRLGNIIAFPQGKQVRVIRVLQLPVRRGPSTEAQTLYENLITGEDRPDQSTKGVDATRIAE